MNATSITEKIFSWWDLAFNYIVNIPNIPHDELPATIIFLSLTFGTIFAILYALISGFILYGLFYICLGIFRFSLSTRDFLALSLAIYFDILLTCIIYDFFARA